MSLWRCPYWDWEVSFTANPKTQPTVTGLCTKPQSGKFEALLFLFWVSYFAGITALAWVLLEAIL